jgi:hypothetical protein
MISRLKPPGTKRLKLKCDILPSAYAFKFNQRRYIKARAEEAANELAVVTAREQKSASQHRIAMSHIKEFNPKKMSVAQWKDEQGQMMARLDELEDAAVAWGVEREELQAAAGAGTGGAPAGDGAMEAGAYTRTHQSST